MRVNVGSLFGSTLSPQGRGQGEGWGTRVAIIDLSKPARPREITYATLDARCDHLAQMIESCRLRLQATKTYPLVGPGGAAPSHWCLDEFLW